MSHAEGSVGIRLNELLIEAGLPVLQTEEWDKFGALYSLFVRWSTRINLTAIRDQDGILSRHFVESIACARALPQGISTLLDFGSGGGFPGIPIAICRPEIAVTLAESQGKKAAFLLEAVRVLGLRTKVHAHRAELLATQFDCVTLRAVDKMGSAVAAASRLVGPGGWLVAMTTDAAAGSLQIASGSEFCWVETVRLPGGSGRIVALGERSVNLSS